MTRRGRGRPPHPDILTPAEWRVLEELRAGDTYAEIAVRLGVSPDAIRFHVRNMRDKLNLRDRAELVAWTPPDGERRRFPALLAPLASLPLAARTIAAVAAGTVVTGAIVVAIALVVASGSGEGTPPAVVVPDEAATTPGPTGTPATTPSPIPEATPVATPEATPTPTPDPATVETSDVTPIRAGAPQATATPPEPEGTATPESVSTSVPITVRDDPVHQFIQSIEHSSPQTDHPFPIELWPYWGVGLGQHDCQNVMLGRVVSADFLPRGSDSSQGHRQHYLTFEIEVTEVLWGDATDDRYIRALVSDAIFDMELLEASRDAIGGSRGVFSFRGCYGEKWMGAHDFLIETEAGSIARSGGGSPFSLESLDDFVSDLRRAVQGRVPHSCSLFEKGLIHYVGNDASLVERRSLRFPSPVESELFLSDTVLVGSLSGIAETELRAERKWGNPEGPFALFTISATEVIKGSVPGDLLLLLPLAEGHSRDVILAELPCEGALFLVKDITKSFEDVFERPANGVRVYGLVGDGLFLETEGGLFHGPYEDPPARDGLRPKYNLDFLSTMQELIAALKREQASKTDAD